MTDYNPLLGQYAVYKPLKPSFELRPPLVLDSAVLAPDALEDECQEPDEYGWFSVEYVPLTVGKLNWMTREVIGTAVANLAAIQKFTVGPVKQTGPDRLEATITAVQPVDHIKLNFVVGGDNVEEEQAEEEAGSS